MNPQQFYGGGPASFDQYPANPKKRFFRSRRGLLILGMTLLLTFTAFAGAYSAMKKNTAEDFMKYAFAEYNAEKSYVYFSADLRDQISSDSWKQRLDEYKKLYGTHTYEQTNKTVKKNDGAQPETDFKYRFIGGDNGKETLDWVEFIIIRNKEAGKDEVTRFDLVQI